MIAMTRRTANFFFQFAIGNMYIYQHKKTDCHPVFK